MVKNTFTSIAEELLVQARELDAYAASKGVTLETADDAFLSSLPDNLQVARDNLIDGTMSLKRAAEGPAALIIGLNLYWADNLSLSAIYHYKIPQAIPLEGSATYAEVAAATGLPPGILHRFVRHAMTNGIFQEPIPGHVAHSPASRLLVTNPSYMDMTGWCTAELVPAANRYFDAVSKYGDSSEPTETAFGLANNSNLPLYIELSKTPERARRFGSAMKSLTSTVLWNVSHDFHNFDWPAYDKPGATVLDIGGGFGHISLYLASHTQHLKFVVQDLPVVIEQAKAVPLAPGLNGRVEFVAQNFMQPQASSPADIVILRAILHNWSDKYAKQIITNLIPALKKGTRVLVIEVILEAGSAVDYTKKIGPDVDMAMALINNGKLRTSEEVQALFKTVDERFVWKATRRSTSISTTAVEMSWEPEV